jgi:hypothetical protein
MKSTIYSCQILIQGDQKVSVHLMITIQKLQVMFKVSPANLQTFIDTPNCVLEDRVQYSTVHIPNVFCDGYLQLISCVGIVLYCNRPVHRDFLITLYETSIYFRQIFKYQSLWKSVQWGPSCSMGTDRPTDVTTLIIAFSKFANAPKNPHP